jgi:FlaA1/EpsC-like NDP-sugar epimerase
MPIIRIEDLAEAMIEQLAPEHGFEAGSIQIVEIGALPGEKLYEELMNQEETRRAIELERFFSITPAFKSVYHEISYDYPGEECNLVVTGPYNSTTGTPLSKSELRSFLQNSGAFEA